MLRLTLLTTAILLSTSTYAAQPTTKIKSINVSDTARIVGGQESSQNGRPYQASVQGTDGYHFCGGSIVASDMILTAAHCLEGVNGENPNMQVRVGTNKLSGNEGETIAVAKTYTNQEYPNLSKDVAILKLEKAITHQNTQIVNLVDQSFVDANIQAGTALTVSGWGTLSSGGQSPDKLMEVSVPFVTNEVCNSSEAYGGQVQDTEMCAGLKEGGKDSCQGDSGGPLVFEKNNEYYQVGVVSWGDGCAAENKYGVYGDVAKLRTWIDSAMSGNEPVSGLAGGDNNGGGDYADATFIAFQEQVSYTVDEEQLQLVLDVPEGVKVMYIATTGGEGDVDITAERTASAPEFNDEGRAGKKTNRWDNWDDWGDYWDMPVSFFSSETQGNDETIIIEAPEAGEWVISLSQFSDFSDVELTIFVH
ncbi:serine protease [Thalassotalea sp. M1531]|uniref:Serine protease n=1 Tax=Thalassotalea algicola TaxID=2716224 RepID=A0A7Y0LG69_9GAMM|nr:serine protease [Thalassotalea algicola]NMP33567.1 serine protease [Thalassotalea algicola]